VRPVRRRFVVIVEPIDRLQAAGLFVFLAQRVVQVKEEHLGPSAALAYVQQPGPANPSALFAWHLSESCALIASLLSGLEEEARAGSRIPRSAPGRAGNRSWGNRCPSFSA
jgi:hypothetical protein